MSGLYEVATWLVYTLAGIMMLTVIAASILAGLGLRLMAEFLREFGNGREEGEAQHAEKDPHTPSE